MLIGVQINAISVARTQITGFIVKPNHKTYFYINKLQ